jgi:hypothetical protein
MDSNLSVRENQIKGFLINANFTITPSSTPTPGWGELRSKKRE